MKKLPDILVILAAILIVIGLIVHFVQIAMGVVAIFEQQFLWRATIALLGLAIAVLLIQIRNK